MFIASFSLLLSLSFFFIFRSDCIELDFKEISYLVLFFFWSNQSLTINSIKFFFNSVFRDISTLLTPVFLILWMFYSILKLCKKLSEKSSWEVHEALEVITLTNFPFILLSYWLSRFESFLSHGNIFCTLNYIFIIYIRLSLSVDQCFTLLNKFLFLYLNIHYHSHVRKVWSFLSPPRPGPSLLGVLCC